jgi:hypothetical protein
LAQDLIIQQPGGAGAGITGINAESNPGARRLSFPILYNLTVVGPDAGTGVSPAVHLRAGTGGIISNAVLLRPGGPALVIEGTESCALAQTDSLRVQGSIAFGGSPLFGPGGGCLDEGAYFTRPELGNALVDPQLVNPFSTRAPDWRPGPSSPAVSGLVPPLDGFFDPLSPYTGGARPLSSVVPWFTGWTVGW